MQLFLTLAALVAVACASPLPEKLDSLIAERLNLDRDARILEQINRHQIDGSYQQSFRTENGIQQTEQGISYPGEKPETGSFVKEGTYEYTADDGQVIVIEYIADENGFSVLNPEALQVALPTPPPTEYPPPRVPGAGLDVPQPLPQFNPNTRFL